jgi:hypothetical protein
MKILPERKRRHPAQDTWPIIVTLLLTTLPLVAAEPVAYTGSAYLVGVPVPGVLCTNASGQVSIKGNVHVLRVECTDPRMTGRLQATMALAYGADGSSTFGGTATQEVGTWNLTDPLHPQFTPMGGVWNLQYRGVGQPDNSNQYTVIGYGIGGAIDGLLMNQTVTRGPGATSDLSRPYIGSGVISAPPADTIVVIDNFNDPPAPSWSEGAGNGSVTVNQTGGQLTIQGTWPFPTQTSDDTTAWTSPTRAWSVHSGQSMETRADLVKLEGGGAGAVLALYHATGIGYWLVKAADYIVVGKHNQGQIFLSAEKLVTPNTNLIMTLGLTPSGADVLLTARILDRSSAGTVLFERSVLDTPASDRSLTVDEVKAATGMTLLRVQNDQPSASWTRGDSPWLGVYQYTDGTLPPATATFDNFELRTFALPQVAMERTLRLSWPESAAADFGVEYAPTAQGPWLPLNTPTWPGFKQLTVPASSDMQFFRLREVP